MSNAAEPRRNRTVARVLGGAAAAGALAWFALAGGLPAGAGAGTGSEAAVPVADEAPGYAVEDFNYPGADKILAEKNIVLKRGDGHITYVDCASGTGFLEVMARRNDKVCFKVVGDSGWLTMEIPAVYIIKGNDYATEVDLTVDSEKKTYEIGKNTWTPVGESADEQGREHLLVEIRTSK
ncbi:hypothetical protein [Streptomyces sp. AC627_RSS907]|uniref:hypothetical protein n=1 Tax=Streptomyces sp. AC627_RSS907 TaxID=2823684 RepID=UPI0020B6721F|nr:hypothetical protein [Streptomyces sp. AC627_RSS907]